jgi:hypothetical protein
MDEAVSLVKNGELQISNLLQSYQSGKNKVVLALYLDRYFTAAADWYLRYQISVYKSSWYEFYGNVRG